MNSKYLYLFKKKMTSDINHLNISSIPPPSWILTLFHEYSLDKKLLEKILLKIDKLNQTPHDPPNAICTKNHTENYYKQIWEVCIVYIVLALDHLNKPKKKIFITSIDLCKYSQVSIQDLYANVKNALELLSNSILSPIRTRSFDKIRTTSLDGSLKLTSNELCVLRDVEIMRLSSITMSIIFHKFNTLWNNSKNNAKSRKTVVENKKKNTTVDKNDINMKIAWLLFISAKRSLQFNCKDQSEIIWSLKVLYSILYLTHPMRHYVRNRNKFEQNEKKKIFGFINLNYSEDKFQSNKTSSHKNTDDKCNELTEQNIQKQAVMIKEMISHMIKQNVFVNKKSVDDVFNDDSLNSKETYSCLFNWYGDNFIHNFATFDERSFILLESSLMRIEGTPTKSFSNNFELTNVSAEHRLSKIEAESAKAVIKVRMEVEHKGKTLFSTPIKEFSSPIAQVSTPISTEIEDIVFPSLNLNEKRKQIYFTSPVSLPPKSPIHAYTPVSSAIETSNWLAREIDYSPDHASHSLTILLDKINHELTKIIDQRINIMGKKLFNLYFDKNSSRIKKDLLFRERYGSENTPQSENNNEDNYLANCVIHNSSETVIKTYLKNGAQLYYRILESVVRGESSKLSSDKFEFLLTNEIFHRALYFCCIEVIFRLKDDFNLIFPAISNSLDIPFYETLNVIDIFVKYTHMLPRVLREHLHCIEIEILSSSVWQKDSQVYSLLNKFNACSDQERQNDADMICIKIFLSKLQALIYERLKALYTSLEISNHISFQYFKDIWNIICFTLIEFTELLVNRHIDCIIICSIFAVMKVKEVSPEISFPKILKNYKAVILTENKNNFPLLFNNINLLSISERFEKIIQNIPLDDKVNSEKVNLAVYYNKIFIVTIKKLLFELNPNFFKKNSIINLLINLENIMPPCGQEQTENNISHQYSKMEEICVEPDLTPYTKNLQVFKNNTLSSNYYKGTPRSPAKKFRRRSKCSRKPVFLRSSSYSILRQSLNNSETMSNTNLKKK